MGFLTIILTGVFHFITKTGIFYCAASFICYVYLKVTERIFGSRFQLYDFNVENDPEKVGFFVPQAEYRMESPQEAVHLKKNADSVFFMGVNSQSESLTVQISRKPNAQVQCSLVLRVDGRTYYLPNEYSILPEVDEPLTFGTSRLKLQCLSPMRRWRIFFNGTLREMASEKDPVVKYRHVKLSILWVASSGAFDYESDMSKAVLTDVAATQGSWAWPPVLFLQRLKSILNNYDQCGMMLGTVTLEGEPEKEIYLWGCRGRCSGGVYAIDEGDFQDIYVNAENGTLIHLGTLNIPGMVTNFIYGFVMKPNGFINPIEKCHVLEEEGSKGLIQKFKCFADGQEYALKVTKDVSKFDFRREFNGEGSVTHAAALLNSMKGRCLIFNGKIQPQVEQAIIKKVLPLIKRLFPLPSTLLSKPLKEPICQLLEVSGGKGSSLAKLCVISDQLKNFTVPNGIIVSTVAYQKFIQGELNSSMQKFEKSVWSGKLKDVKSECQSVMGKICGTQLPESVKKSVEASMIKTFGKQFVNMKFAVRSSATGEDTEQMSAAGQMETFLGCRGLKEIFQGLKKCWASQFSHIAVEYKRRYGQPLNSPMAVVIQEMVPCDAAGVIFTCDPVTGNPAYISITANYGLGESVVSASADPDTITLRRDEYNNISLHNQAAGQKKSKIIMDESNGTREVSIAQEEANDYCIGRETALQLGEIAIKIEEIFGNPRDIEWGVLNGKIYLFQSRPVTSLDIETDFEMRHSFDSYLRREDEYCSTANVAEVLPGATSPLGIDVMLINNDLTMSRQKYVRWDGEALPYAPYFAKRFFSCLNHILFYISDAFLRFSESEGDNISEHTKSMSVAIFGRVIEDKKMIDIAKDRHKGSKQNKISIIGNIYIWIIMFFARYLCKRTVRKYKNFHIPIKKNDTPEEILRSLSINFDKTTKMFHAHYNCSMCSAFWNNSLLFLLHKAKGGWDNDVFGDFGYLMSTCTGVESADVPSSLQKLGFVISNSMDPNTFKKMSVEEALHFLETTPSEAGIKFRDFLKKHGHRCLKEFDVYSVTWGKDPKSLVKMLQGLVSKELKDPVDKAVRSFGSIVSNMQIKVDFLTRLKMRFLLPNCRRGVRGREYSKSNLVRVWNELRIAVNKLADVMMEEGRLPSRELLFFMNIEEVRRLIETRSPRLLAKAFRRWRLHPEMDKIIFPEIASGIPRPVNLSENVATSDGFTMTGTPVSHGTIKGTARVVLSLSDANQIQSGDILITYSTDIGWSPYFALLSGVATEIGGLISHGAVVAREYGLPCVVNLSGASRHFKSGDVVILDGNQGTLKKIETA